MEISEAEAKDIINIAIDLFNAGTSLSYEELIKQAKEEYTKECIQINSPVKYKSKRMEYNPTFHDRQGEEWSVDDECYLINWYDKIGAVEISLAIGKTVGTIMNKVHWLRKYGLMPQQSKRVIKGTRQNA